MRILTAVFLLGLLGPATIAQAERGDETLRFYMERSAWVLSATLMRPVGIVDEKGVVSYFAGMTDVKTLHGPAPAEDGNRVDLGTYIVRERDLPSYIAEGGPCILFLKPRSEKEPHVWVLADPWFGVQPRTLALETAITRLSRMPDPDGRSAPQ